MTTKTPVSLKGRHLIAIAEGLIPLGKALVHRHPHGRGQGAIGPGSIGLGGWR